MEEEKKEMSNFVRVDDTPMLEMDIIKPLQTTISYPGLYVDDPTCRTEVIDGDTSDSGETDVEESVDETHNASPKKYELLKDDTIVVENHVLYRIRALIDIDYIDVCKGDLGGYIEKEENLSHLDNAWVYEGTVVSGSANVSDNAVVSGDAWVSGNVVVSGNARISTDAEICSPNHILVIGPIGSRNDYTTFYRTKDKGISVKCGCFEGALEYFKIKVEQTHGDNIHGEEYRLAIELAKFKLLNGGK